MSVIACRVTTNIAINARPSTCDPEPTPSTVICLDYLRWGADHHCDHERVFDEQLSGAIEFNQRDDHDEQWIAQWTCHMQSVTRFTVAAIATLKSSTAQGGGPTTACVLIRPLREQRRSSSSHDKQTSRGLRSRSAASTTSMAMEWRRDHHRNVCRKSPDSLRWWQQRCTGRIG